jgi:phosphatidylethanolamine/phosphatidyl-N-methylethanolamine N-methyltransferase
MASVIDLASDLPVLELGPGTGVITRAILARGVKPENIWSVEYSPDFVDHLRDIFPSVNVMHGDAFDLGASLPDGPTLFDCAISGIPLLNFPVERRIALVNGVLDRLPVTGSAAARRVFDRAFRLRRPQPAASPALDLPSRRARLISRP